MTFNTAKWLDLDEFMIFVARRIQNTSSTGSRQSNGGQPRSRSLSQPTISVPIIKCEPTPDSLQGLLDCAIPDDHVSACRQKRKIPSGTPSAPNRDAIIQSPEIIEISDSEESNPPPRPLVHATQMKKGRKRKHVAVPDR